MTVLANRILGTMDRYGGAFGRILSTIVASVTTFAFVNTMAQIF